MGGFQHGVPWQLHWLAIEQPWSAQAEPFLTLLAQTDSGIRIRKGIEFWRYCLQKCVAKATTVEDQLEAVRGDITMRLIQLNAMQKTLRW